MRGDALEVGKMYRLATMWRGRRVEMTARYSAEARGGLDLEFDLSPLGGRFYTCRDRLERVEEAPPGAGARMPEEAHDSAWKPQTAVVSEDELFEFERVHALLREKAADARDAWKESTGARGCDDYFSVSDGTATWVGEYNDSCSCHPEMRTGEWSMGLAELASLDLDAYRASLAAAAAARAREAAERDAETAAAYVKKREQAERATYDLLRAKFGGGGD